MVNVEYPMERTMSVTIKYINNFRLNIYRNSYAEQKHFLYKSDEKEFNFIIPL